MSNKWLEWARRIQSLSQAGLAFSKDAFEIERYEELRNISAEILTEYSGLEMKVVKDIFTHDTGYQTPKVDVRGVVFKENTILLVQEAKDSRWSLPGGFCDVGLSPAENIVKEIEEESGFEVVPTKLVALLDMNKHPHPPQAFHYYKVFIQCDIVGGYGKPGLETKAIDFYEKDNLPELSTSRNTASQIQMLFEFLDDPNKETIFD
ncbi:NUDIX hydrolase [Paucisalibacillus globulus]|uniref:NUDIX hydrolase n=1 Tax=Paucisalibacillus globulus TaxID=351095 RepID=UPI000BB8AD36|nr:NUDIX hydrolase [Paucisalibacillus globulus]